MSDLIKEYFPELSKKQLILLEDYKKLLLDWNSKVNLISRKDQNHIDEHHLLHSLYISKFYQFLPNSKVIDIGTGGGLPGIPLALLFPETEFILIDSRKNKINALKDIIKRLNLPNVIAINERVESIIFQYHLAIGRAVSDLKVIINWINKNVKPLPGEPFLIYLKGIDAFDELKNIPYKYTIRPINEFVKLTY